jgi:hypothetical protein
VPACVPMTDFEDEDDEEDEQAIVGAGAEPDP